MHRSTLSVSECTIGGQMDDENQKKNVENVIYEIIVLITAASGGVLVSPGRKG